MTGWAAVTFDYGDTLESRGSDLADRHLRVRQVARWAARRGLSNSGDVDRCALALTTALRDHRIGPDLRHVDVRRIAERVAADVDPRAGADDVAELVGALADPGPDRRITWAPGLPETLVALRSSGLVLGIVSNLRLTSGSGVRGCLRRAGLLDLFEPAGCAFSDEVGVHKPDPVIFGVALRGLGVAPSAAIHVGDSRAADVAGARAAGMTTVRFTGFHDDPGPGPEADYRIAALTELPGLLHLTTPAPLGGTP